MKPKDREIVFNKYAGKCAYCGCILEKGWHVDHLEPVRRSFDYVKDETGDRIWDSEKRDYKKICTMDNPQNDCLQNYMPSCASCNINKHSDSLESFRQLIQNFKKHLNELNTQYKISKRYGLVIEVDKPVVFYFETFLDK